MPKTAGEIPPPLELLCLRALWSLKEATVKQVQKLVSESRPLAYTTIMTVLDRLVKKGKLSRRKAGRAFVYTPRESLDEMRRVAVRQLVDNFFGSSEEELLRFLGRQGESQAAAAAASGEGSRIDTVLL
jgi:BlaI family penicillinase repressor